MSWETMAVMPLRICRRATDQDALINRRCPRNEPPFSPLGQRSQTLGLRVIDRCNLTILAEPGYEDLAQFLADSEVEIVASLPCYLEENVNKQRGDGVFSSQPERFAPVKCAGYGLPDSGRVLNLVYNPTGASLPPNQAALELAHKEQLATRYGIVFNQLLR